MAHCERLLGAFVLVVAATPLAEAQTVTTTAAGSLGGSTVNFGGLRAELANVYDQTQDLLRPRLRYHSSIVAAISTDKHLQWGMRCTLKGDRWVIPAYRLACKYRDGIDRSEAMSLVLVGESPSSMTGLAVIDSPTGIQDYRVVKSGDNWQLFETDTATQTASSTTSVTWTSSSTSTPPTVHTSTTSFDGPPGLLARWTAPSFTAERRLGTRITQTHIDALAVASVATTAKQPPLQLEEKRTPLAPAGAIQVQAWRGDVRAQFHVDHFLKVGRPDLAAALGEMYVLPIQGQDERDDLFFFEITQLGYFVNMGLTTLVPRGGGDVGRYTTAQFLFETGLDLGYRWQALFRLQAGRRDISTAGPAEDVLGNFGSRDGIVSGSWFILGGLRYILGTWALRPYAGVLAGHRGGHLEYTSPNTSRACNPFCTYFRGYGMDIKLSGPTVAPHVGVNWTLGNAKYVGATLKAEAALFFSYMGAPQLRFEGNPTSAGLDDFDRLKNTSFGGPAIDLALSLAFEVRFAVGLPLDKESIAAKEADLSSPPWIPPPVQPR